MTTKKKQKKSERKKKSRLRDYWPEMKTEDRVDLLKRSGYSGAAQLWYSEDEWGEVPDFVRANLGDVYNGKHAGNPPKGWKVTVPAFIRRDCERKREEKLDREADEFVNGLIDDIPHRRIISTRDLKEMALSVPGVTGILVDDESPRNLYAVDVVITEIAGFSVKSLIEKIKTELDEYGPLTLNFLVTAGA